MTPEQLTKFTEIRRLLQLGYDRHSRYDDGVHKSADGSCEVHYPTAYWDGDDGCGGIEADSLMVYSYVLGPSRAHHFYKGNGRSDDNEFYSDDPFATALAQVQKWIAAQAKYLKAEGYDLDSTSPTNPPPC